MSSTKKVTIVVFWICIILFNAEILNSQTLVNSNATVQAKELKSFLDSVKGKKILSGQAFEDVNENWLTIISNASGGKQPAIMSLDFMNSSPLRVSMGTNPDETTNKAIDWVKNKGGLLEMHWHWDAPLNVTGDKWQAFYTKNTSFDVAAAMNDVNSEDYKLLVRDIDIVSQRLLRLQNEGIALLWRPLHEAEGKWFWWGVKTGDACKKLYRMMYDRMVNYHKINNLVWVWTSYGTAKENWYPGDDVVDIIAWDYPDYNAQSGSWSQYQQLFGTKGKLFTLGEIGELFNPELLQSQPWLYFITWAYMIKDPSQQNGKNTASWVNQVYNDSRVLTLEDLQPGLKAKAGSSQILDDKDGNGKEWVSLDASESSTKTGQIIAYSWSISGVEIAVGAKASVELPIGVHEVSLTVKTDTGETKTAKVLITIKLPSLSKKKSFIASSTEANLGNIASNALDGDYATRWSSAYSDPQWYQIDLEKKINISQVVIFWEDASAKNYTMEVSDDGITWKTIVTKTDMSNGKRTDDLNGLSGSGRYIRMFGTARTSIWGYSIFEIEVYGSESGTTGLFDTERNKMRLYPTLIRKSENLQIECTPDLLCSNYQIYNLSGQLVKQGTLVENINSLNIDESFSPGMYIFKGNGTGFHAVKFMVQD